MHSPLFNSFILVCKLVTCISVFLSLKSHHWIRDIDGKEYRGLQKDCYDYGHFCYERDNFKRGIWFFYILALLNANLELLNILFLCKRTRSRINLILEEIGVLISIIFVLIGSLISLGIFIIIGVRPTETFDWSFLIFFLSIVLALIELICSVVRVVSYCRDNSFRSSVITYTSNMNHEIVHIQS